MKFEIYQRANHQRANGQTGKPPTVKPPMYWLKQFAARIIFKTQSNDRICTIDSRLINKPYGISRLANYWSLHYSDKHIRVHLSDAGHQQFIETHTYSPYKFVTRHITERYISVDTDYYEMHYDYNYGIRRIVICSQPGAMSNITILYGDTIRMRRHFNRNQLQAFEIIPDCTPTSTNILPCKHYRPITPMMFSTGRTD